MERNVDFWTFIYYSEKGPGVTELKIRPENQYERIKQMSQKELLEKADKYMVGGTLGAFHVPDDI